MVILGVLDILFYLVGMLSIAYQAICIVAGLVCKSIEYPECDQTSYFAVLISARNEEAVIGNLITSIQQQTYPQDHIDIWVVADNCTDHTADVVRSYGCHVVERFNQKEIGKGYALSLLLDTILQQGLGEHYDAYFVFDADNRLDPNYIAEMNKGYRAGYRIVTGYRNSLNLSENWVSSGSALWFIRESRFLNNSRMVMGSSCHVGGTGFMFSREVMLRNQGWHFHLLTEDLEFTMDSLLHGDHVGYCGKAILYDEQPVTFAQSWRQRLRWSKGFLQVFRYYGGSLLKHAVRERDFSAIDFAMLLWPFMTITVVRTVLGALFAAFGFISWQHEVHRLVQSVGGVLVSILVLMLLAALTVIAERGRIGATNKELLAYVLSFPIYMLSYIPISFQALFAKSEWKPIVHKGDGSRVKVASQGVAESLAVGEESSDAA